MKDLIYLAVPYSHPSPAVRECRFELANLVAARLMREGLHVFSPISHTHPIALAGQLPTGYDFWEKYDRAFLEVARELRVIRIPGWEESKGVQSEMRVANELGIPIVFEEPTDDEVGAAILARPR